MPRSEPASPASSASATRSCSARAWPTTRPHLARLAARRAGALEAVNLAVPGYNAVMEVETLREKGLGFRPDIVIVEFIGNDLDLPNFIAAEPPVLSLRRWFLADFVKQRLRSRRRGAGESGLVAAPRETWDLGKYRSEPDSVPAAYRDLVGWPAVSGPTATCTRRASSTASAWSCFAGSRSPTSAAW